MVLPAEVERIAIRQPQSTRSATLMSMKILPMSIVLAFASLPAYAQSAIPTANVLSRVLMIQSQYDIGTVFSIDVDNKEYWITAKHILTGRQHPPYGDVRTDKVRLKVLNPGAEGEQWIDREFSTIDIDPDIDEVVLAPATPLLDNPLPSAKTGSEAVALGGDCSFLGFPYGGGWKAKFSNGQSSWMPFTKRCAVSAMLRDPQRIWILDGINNIGFSGGPVLSGTGMDQRIFAVISGYRVEPAEVISAAAQQLSPPPVSKDESQSPDAEAPAAKSKQSVNVNSGFIIAYDIGYAIDAIHKKPIGPIRQLKTGLAPPS